MASVFVLPNHEGVSRGSHKRFEISRNVWIILQIYLKRKAELQIFGTFASVYESYEVQETPFQCNISLFPKLLSPNL